MPLQRPDGLRLGGHPRQTAPCQLLQRVEFALERFDQGPCGGVAPGGHCGLACGLLQHREESPQRAATPAQALQTVHRQVGRRRPGLPHPRTGRQRQSQATQGRIAQELSGSSGQHPQMQQPGPLLTQARPETPGLQGFQAVGIVLLHR